MSLKSTCFVLARRPALLAAIGDGLGIALPVPLVGPVAGETFRAGVALPRRIGACVVLLAPAAVQATALLVGAWCRRCGLLDVTSPIVLGVPEAFEARFAAHARPACVLALGALAVVAAAPALLEICRGVGGLGTGLWARLWARLGAGLGTWGRTGQAGLVTLPVPLVETAAGEIALTLDSPPDLVFAHGFALAAAAPALHIRRRA